MLQQRTTETVRDTVTQTKLYLLNLHILPAYIYTTHTRIRDGPGITRVMKLVLQCVIFIRLRLLRARINKQLQFLFLTIARVLFSCEKKARVNDDFVIRNNAINRSIILYNIIFVYLKCAYIEAVGRRWLADFQQQYTVQKKFEK